MDVSLSIPCELVGPGVSPIRMALSAEQQAIELISRANTILVTTRENPTVDSIASVVAVGLLLKKLQKNFDAVIAGWDPKQAPDFLPQTVEIAPEIGAMRTFHLEVNVKDVPLAELAYDVKNDLLDIAIIPKKGSWTPQDITFKHGEDRYDLVITVDAPDLASIGAFAREQADFFYRTPIINIDANPTNEYWGQVNLVDLNAVSTTEVLFGWIERWNRSLVDEPMGTALLAGMVAKTKSFRTANVTPKTLAASSTLVELGAKREQIVHGLWRTRSVRTLKLWGRALSRLEQDHELGLVWTTLGETDFVEAGVGPEALEGVVDELISYAPEAKAIAVITQRSSQLLVNLYASAPFSADELARPFNGSGTRDHATFSIVGAHSLLEATQQVIDRLKQTMGNVR